jgi:hypothetical protein
MLPIINRVYGLKIQFICYNILVASVHRFWFWCTDYVFMYALVISVHKCWLHVHRLLVTMDSCSEHMDRSPMRISLTRRLFSTPVVTNDDAGHTLQSIVTPVTHAGLDPLMRSALQTPLLSITPIVVETPLGECYTHAIMLFPIMCFEPYNTVGGLSLHQSYGLHSETVHEI